MLPLSILAVVENLQKLPGVGKRGAQKLALDILETSDDNYENLIITINNMKQNVHFCTNCGFFAEASHPGILQTKTSEKIHSNETNNQEILCNICLDRNRTLDKICLVEKSTDILNLEKTQIYGGVYHVLRQLISPIENIFAENTQLPDLLQRRIPSMIASHTPENPLEIILFFKAGFGADTTLAYIKDYIRNHSWQDRIVISKLAEGLPLYYNPENLDQATMIRALEDRRTLNL